MLVFHRKLVGWVAIFSQLGMEERGAKLKVFIHPWCLGGTDVDAVLPRHSR